MTGPSLALAAALMAPHSLPAPAAEEGRMDWWREARFGMFIHWGLYSIPAGEWKGKVYGGASEWLMNTAQIKAQDYAPLRDQFNPVKFNARAWVRLAKRAGMKYMVITSKHHDGFCLWDSDLTDWDVMASPFRRDILKELAQACREEGMKLGFYHSILDWTHPLYGERRSWDPRPEAGPTNMDRYTAHMKGQLKELLTRYGDVATVWFDGEWEEPWTHERGKDLYDYVLSLQPRTLVNNRVDKGRAGMAGMTVGESFRGDYGTPEQEVPARGLPGVDWESCMTMNNSWGYHRHDSNWKSAGTLIETLVETASKGGNFLLNVGPTSEGVIPEESAVRLEEMGKWLKVNGRAVYGTQAGPFSRSAHRWTRKGQLLYVFLREWKPGPLTLDGIISPVTRARALGGGSISFKQEGGRLVAALAGRQPSSHLSVLEIQTRGDLKVEEPKLTPDAAGVLTLQASLAEIQGQTLRHEGSWLGFWTKAEDGAVWEAEKLPSGRYRVELDYALDAGSAGSTGVVLVGGQRLEFKPEPTGGWQAFQTLRLGSISLAGGSVRVEVRPVKMAGALMNLRTVRLIRQ